MVNPINRCIHLVKAHPRIRRVELQVKSRRLDRLLLIATEDGNEVGSSESPACASQRPWQSVFTQLTRQKKTRSGARTGCITTIHRAVIHTASPTSYFTPRPS
jgi:hypothetical protein